MYVAGRLTILLMLMVAPGIVDGQERKHPDQYRFGRESIPAATADEPASVAFSSLLTKEHMDSAVKMWAQQKQCVSCHTHGIYMLARPSLTPFWGAPSDETRSFLIAEVQQIRNDASSRNASTPVQMAYIARGLAEWDSCFSDSTSQETVDAIGLLFEMQADDGSIRVPNRWPPLNSTTYHGTAMAAMATTVAPGWLEGLEDRSLLAKINRLKDYLKQTPPKNDHERVLLLWASASSPDLLSDADRRQFLETIWSHQRSDGGWSVRSFATPENLGGGRRAESLKTDADYLKAASDGYQTGLVVVVLRDLGISADDPRIQNAVSWLLTNQRQSGRWWTQSLNTNSRFHFISFSGTAYAALALAKCDALPVAR